MEIYEKPEHFLKIAVTPVKNIGPADGDDHFQNFIAGLMRCIT